jgi:hypothetical protein
MPAIETGAVPKVAGMARSYAARLSLFVVPACGVRVSRNPVSEAFSGCRIKSGMPDCKLFISCNPL